MSGLPTAKTPSDFPFKYTGLPDKWGVTQNFGDTQSDMDSRPIFNQDQLNLILSALASIVLGDTGAKTIGYNGDASGENVQEALDLIGIAGSGTIPPDDSISTTKLQDNSVTNVKMADDSIGADELIDDSVGNAAMADDAIDTPQIAADAVTNDELADNAIAIENMQNNSVDTPELVALAVSTAKIEALAVTTAKLQNGGVTFAKLNDDVTTPIGNNTTHRGSDGTDHSKVVDNTAATGQNTTHRNSNGTDHADVGSNNTHRAGDGSDHADVATNTADISDLQSNRPILGGGDGINGNLDIWQDGTLFSTPSGFSADMWFHKIISGVAHTIERVTNVPNSSSKYSLENTFTVSASTATERASNYIRIRGEDSQKYNGKTKTISGYYYKTSSAYSVRIIQAAPSALDNWTSNEIETLNSISDGALNTWIPFSFTYTMPSTVGGNNTSNGYGYGLETYAGGGLPAGACTTIISQLKLEDGVGTDFIPNTVADELVASQYYYRKFSLASAFGIFGIGFAHNSTTVRFMMHFAEMRTAPTLETTGVAGDYRVINAGGGTVCNSVPVLNGTANTWGAEIVFTVASGLTQYRPYEATAQSNINAYLAFDSRLGT